MSGTTTKRGALISRIGFWGPVYYKYDMEPNIIGNYLRPPYYFGCRAGSAIRGLKKASSMQGPCISNGVLGKYYVKYTHTVVIKNNLT